MNECRVGQPIGLTRTIIYGDDLRLNSPPLETLLSKNQPLVTYQQLTGDGFGLNDSLLSRHVLFMGETGTGKTNAMSHGLECLLRAVTEHDVVFIFDVKGDYARRFFQPDSEKHVMFGGGRYGKYSSAWNVYEEIFWAADAHGVNALDKNTYIETYAYEIAKDFFHGRQSESQPFFCEAAEHLLSCVLVDHIRSAYKTRDSSKLNNGALVQFFRQATPETYLELANRNTDFASIKTYFGDGKNNQGLGVFGELNACINACLRDIFSDTVGARGTFSVSQAVQKRGGYIYFIEYDIGLGEALGPMYRLLIDFILKSALSQQTEPHGNVYLIMDELRAVGELAALEQAMNLGRGLGLKIWASVQSVSQLISIYNEQRARAMLAGFANLFAFKSLDKESRALIAERTGRCYEDVFYRAHGTPVHIQRDGNCIEDWDILNLETGEAIIALADYKPFLFQFPLYL